MAAFVDLHCHWVADIDDGAKNHQQSEAILRGLLALGFEKVVATPHMRPDLFDNSREELIEAYETTRASLSPEAELPETALACEHFFDDVVYRRIITGQGIPYPGERSILIELGYDQSPSLLRRPIFEMRRQGLTPVLAHPERYKAAWKAPESILELEDYGVVMLLDMLALVGVYGRKPKKVAERWLEAGLYYAACTDAHNMKHVESLANAMERLRALVGPEEMLFLLSEGPTQILQGQVQL